MGSKLFAEYRCHRVCASTSATQPAKLLASFVVDTTRRNSQSHPGSEVTAAMARTYRDIAIEDMVRTVEEAMSRVIDWWGDLPPPMKDAVEQFRTQLGAAIDSVEFVKRALDRQVPETDYGEGPP
jgi:hypothetical protein